MPMTMFAVQEGLSVPVKLHRGEVRTALSLRSHSTVCEVLLTTSIIDARKYQPLFLRVMDGVSLWSRISVPAELQSIMRGRPWNSEI